MIAILLGFALGSSVGGSEFEPAHKLLINDQPIDVQREGHSAPFVGDVDRDGKDDLLVGEYYQGRMRIYRNSGSNTQREFGTHDWFVAGGELGRVPEG